MLAAALLLVTGCADNKTIPVATEPDLVTHRIAQASEKAATALDTIAGIEQQRGPMPPLTDQYMDAPPALMQHVSIKWTGPIEQIAEALSLRAGLAFRVHGAKPPVPLVVTVDVFQKPIIEVLRDLGLQAGDKADLQVDARNNVTELNYAAVSKLRVGDKM